VPHAAGFVNAVLRAAARGDVAFPDREREPADFLATWGSHPRWIVERWIARFGVEAASALCDFDNRRPEVCLRANRLRSSRAELLAELPGSRPGALSPDAVKCATPAYAAVRRVVEAGRASVQDESGMLVAPLLDPQPGESVVDLAAAPGGKACHLAELRRDTGTVLAFDRNPNRLERVRENAARLGLQSVVAARADARRLAARPSDGVLLDAPCSGLGVLGRRPDLRWRKRPADLPRLAKLQRDLLDAACRHVRPGGRLVYSVCSFEPEETVEVAAGFSAAHPDLEPDDVESTEALRAGPGFLYFLPHRDGTDGGFAARWRRRG
jgi:16S rRNA (cytosine967-C5)-methyltransferase